MANSLAGIKNDISETQNSQHQIRRLAAQRQLYSDAKRVLFWQLIFTILGTVILSLLNLFAPWLSVWQAVYGLLIAVLEVIWDRQQKSLREQAAKIQELFDCDVLGLTWNALEVGARPDAETIIDSSSRLRQNKADYQQLRNWYPKSVSMLPIHLARLVCQRTNLRWDSQLRRWFGRRIFEAALVVIVLLFILSLWGGLSLEKFVLSVLVPALPVFLWGVREYFRQNDAADELERLKTSVEELWLEAISGNVIPAQIESSSRRLQDVIFTLRKNSPLIFNEVYQFFRNRYEMQAVKGAEELVREAMQSDKSL